MPSKLDVHSASRAGAFKWRIPLGARVKVAEESVRDYQRVWWLKVKDRRGTVQRFWYSGLNDPEYYKCFGAEDSVSVLWDGRRSEESVAAHTLLIEQPDGTWKRYLPKYRFRERRQNGTSIAAENRLPAEKRRTPSIRLRFAVFTRDNFACVYCGRKPPEVELSPDHVIPFSKGGKTTLENLVTSCRHCNAGKSDQELPR